jgi:hypothetical protein
MVAAICGQKRPYNSEKLFETRTHSSVTASLRPSLRLWNGAQGSWWFGEPDGQECRPAVGKYARVTHASGRYERTPFFGETGEMMGITALPNRKRN